MILNVLYRIPNPGAGGSNPLWSTIKSKGSPVVLAGEPFFVFLGEFLFPLIRFSRPLILIENLGGVIAEGNLDFQPIRVCCFVDFFFQKLCPVA